MSDLLIPNNTQIPNIIFDKLMYRLGDAEFRVLMYICRRTYGFQRQSDQISYSQFVSGIIKKDGTRLDGGCGVGKNAVSLALKSLIDLNIIIVEKNRWGNHYRINLDVDIKELVLKKDMSLKRTGSSHATGLEVVSLQDTQKKVTKESTKLSAEADERVFVLKEEIEILDQSKRRDMQIIGGYLDYVYDRVKDNISTRSQFSSFIKANLKIAKELSDAGYTDYQLSKAFDSVRRKYEGKIDWKLSTVHKELTS